MMLIRPDEQEIATPLDLLVGHMHERGRERNPTKFRNLSPQWNFKGYSSLRHVKINILYLFPSITKEELKCLDFAVL